LTERERRERRDDSEAETAPGARALADAAPRLDDAREHAPVIARRETTVRTPPPACERLALLRGSKGGTPSRRARRSSTRGRHVSFARLRAQRAVDLRRQRAVRALLPVGPRRGRGALASGALLAALARAVHLRPAAGSHRVRAPARPRLLARGHDAANARSPPSR